MDLVTRIDHAFGDRVEQAMRNHHYRRLRRLGWTRAFEPEEGLWAAGDPPPRKANSLDVLIDGSEAFPQIASEIRRASSHVHLAGWFVTPEVTMAKGEPPLLLKDLLAEVSRRIDVRVLLWAGAPLPRFRKSMRAVGDELMKTASIHFAVDNKERPLHCHHEKIIVIDDAVAFVGGLDLTTRNGNRFDSSDHRARGEIGWHDATTRLEGPIVSDVVDHFRLRWGEVTGHRLPPAPEAAECGDVEAQLVRTIPEKVYRAVPKGDFRVLEAYVRALKSAHRFIYIESQYLWSPEIIAILRDKLLDPPSDDFRMLFLLPSKANTGSDNTVGQLAVLAEADDGAERFLACTLFARHGAEIQPIYVHAKISIVDDRWLTVGSANLNDHSLFNDTEVNIVTCDPKVAETTRKRLWAEHLELPLESVQEDPQRMIDTVWKPIATEQMERRDAGAPLTHRLARLPHISRRSKRVVGPLESLFLDG